ncbi:MAG: PAS domain-containing protein [Chitinophagales bacterium]
MEYSNTFVFSEKENAELAGFEAVQLVFQYLPAYAAFLLKDRLKPFVIKQVELVRELNPPLIRFVGHLTDEELVEMGKTRASKMLSLLARNKAAEFVGESVQSWLSNQLTLISRDQVSTEDIIGLSYIRRRVFRDFLTDFTNDLFQSRMIMQELDQVLAELDSISIKNLFRFQQDLYNQAQSMAKVGNWTLDLQSDKLTWSDELFRIYDLEPGSAIPSDLSKYNHPDDQEMISMQMAIARRSGDPFDFYYRIILKNGMVKMLHAKGRAETDPAGKPSTMIGTVQDATQQKEVEKEILAGQIFIRKIADLTPSIISVYNVRLGKYIFINHAIKTVLGYEPDEAMSGGIDFFVSIIHPDDLPAVDEKNRKALKFANTSDQLENDTIIIDFIYRMRHKNGQWLWFQTYGNIFSRDKENQVEEVINISVDITEQASNALELEKKNRELSKSEEKYHKMTEMVEDYAILLLNKDGLIENWNQGAEKIKGYKAEEIVGKHFRIFHTREDQENHVPEKLIEKARSEGKATHEGWRARKNGENFWGYIVITALRDENNEIFGFSKVTRDLTEKREADLMLQKFSEEMQVKNQELEQSLKDLESFSYAASHDLQEPLRKIKTFTHFILNNEQDQLSELSRGYFERIVSATDRMQRLIEALLQFSMIRTLTPAYEKTDLNNILEEAKKDLFEISSTKDTTIRSDKLPVVNVIPMQLQQVFFNILSNSLKYRKQNEHLHIYIESGKIDHCEFLHQPGTGYKISFIDNGIGFEQQYAEKIFALFQRLHGKKEYPGTGIGLSICKKIMLNHHGSIQATGELGKGARFDLYLPA